MADAIKNLDFEAALNLRDPYFKSNYQMISSLQVTDKEVVNTCDDESTPATTANKFTVGLINVGAPCGGMNTANRAVVHYCLNRGHVIKGIFNGFSGLLADDVRQLKWSDVDGWVSQGGSELGTNRHVPEDDSIGGESLGKTAMKLQEHRIEALVLIGGFEAFTALLQLSRSRHLYPAFAIPMICLPATVSNNVPGTDFSIGSDTALNSIMEMCDCIKQSASSSRKRLFVVDVQGGYCGYLATVSCLIAGGTHSYIHEEGVSLEDLLRESKHLRSRFADDKRQGRLIIRNERCSPTFTAEVMSKIFEQEAQGSFDSRWVSLGHIVQGGRPSPLDRIRATRLAVMAVNYLEAWLCPEALPAAVKGQFMEMRQLELDAQNVSIMSSNPYLAAAVIGIHVPEVICTSAFGLAEKQTLMRYRIPSHQWWLALRKLNRILAKYEE